MENIKQNLDNNVNPWVNNILRQDLKTLIDQKGKPLEQISQFSNVPTSILKDVLDGSSLLSDATIYRFYEYFLSIVDDSETSVRHEWIKAKYLNEKRKNDNTGFMLVGDAGRKLRLNKDVRDSNSNSDNNMGACVLISLVA